MEAKRKIKLEIIVGRKKIFEANGEWDDVYFDVDTQIYWKNQKPTANEFGMKLEDSKMKLSDSYRCIFLATNSKVKRYSNNYQIKTTIGRIRNDSK